MQAAGAPSALARMAERAERKGWAGLSLVDSQNLAGDVYVGLAMIASATSRLAFGPGVTNTVTRHPAATAAAIASLQEISGGRASLGIGRGDSALAHLGRAPVRVAPFERYLAVLQLYLAGETVPFEDLAFQDASAPDIGELGLAEAPDGSRLHWLRRDIPKVPVEVAATGPRVIGVAARGADRVMLSVGADPERIRWGVETIREARRQADLDPNDVAIGAYVNLACDPDLTAARDLVSGGLATFVRFAAMDGRITGKVSSAQREVLEGVHRAYDMRRHTRVGAQQTAALTPEFVDRYAIVGDGTRCVERLREIASLGIDKFIVVGATAGADRTRAKAALDRLEAEVLPAFSSPETPSSH